MVAMVVTLAIMYRYLGLLKYNFTSQLTCIYIHKPC